MVWGSISQVLKVTELPPGLKMYITNVQLDVPGGNNQWWPTFAGITKNSKEADRKKVFPFEVGPSINYGRIGEVGLTSLSNFDSGDGPSARIEFMICGELTVDGQTKAVGQKGTVTVSTPPWGGFWSGYSNPSTIMVAYNLVDSVTLNHQVDISRSGHTLDLLWAVGLDKTGTQLTMAVGPEKSLAFDVANLMLGGVRYVHEATYGWVFGALGGWPAVVGYVGGEGIRKLVWGE